MEIKKVLNLSTDEFEILSKAGEIAGSIKKAYEAGEIDQLGEDTQGILEGLLEVFNKIVFNKEAWK